jgi:RNA polymerase sigma-70 factor (ECF subfamily)
MTNTVDDLIAAARDGQEAAFRVLVEPHLPGLRLHCYRMLASFHDADDALQDVLLSAWRSLHTYEGRAPLAHWLMRIATTTCLKAIAARARQPVSVDDLAYLEPYPDRLLDGLAAGTDPAAEAERRESVSLAFIAALQLLPPTQRAALILRDVLAWRGDEVADLLDTTVPAVNSLLQRARAALTTVDRSRPRRPLDLADEAVLFAFVAAWNRSNVAAIAALLHRDVVMRMPPETMVVAGRDALVEFYATVPAAGRLDTVPLTVTRSNGQPAVAAFEGGDRARPYGLMVFDIVDGAIVSIIGFPTFTRPLLASAFGLETAC